MGLPTWNVLKTHYPAYDAGTIFQKIGGKVELNYDIRVFNNACAIRVSKALNGSGGTHVIPFFKDIGPSGKREPQTSSGKNKKMLVKHLKSRYGEPEVSTPSDYKTEFDGRKGVIVFEVTGWSDAT